MNPETLDLIYHLLPLQFLNTIYMVLTSTILASLIGIPLGVILAITTRAGIKESPIIYKLLSTAINAGRSFPFAILMVALIPLTRWIIGTSLGTHASIVPLTVAAAPLMARLVETSLKEVDKQVVEAAIVMGSNPWQIISKVLLPESLPSLVQSLTVTMVNLIGCSAMVGLIGGGGLGQVAVQYGYHRFNATVMILTVALIIALVQFVQSIGNHIVYSIYKRQGRAHHD